MKNKENACYSAFICNFYAMRADCRTETVLVSDNEFVEQTEKVLYVYSLSYVFLQGKIKIIKVVILSYLIVNMINWDLNKTLDMLTFPLLIFHRVLTCQKNSLCWNTYGNTNHIEMIITIEVKKTFSTKIHRPGDTTI